MFIFKRFRIVFQYFIEKIRLGRDRRFDTVSFVYYQGERLLETVFKVKMNNVARFDLS